MLHKVHLTQGAWHEKSYKERYEKRREIYSGRDLGGSLDGEGVSTEEKGTPRQRRRKPLNREAGNRAIEKKGTR